MGEFDLSLINEYRSRPSFYDRNAPRFKDKLYNAHLWQDISNKLGFDVSILKDRILQLRNRYNLEKRRIEQLREENPNKEFDSPWPLYDHLHFLSDHIRARRSYKKMMPLNGLGGDMCGPYVAAPDLSNSGSNNSNLTLRQMNDSGSAATANEQNLAAFPNGLLAVKMEDGTETEDETESQNNDSEINAFDTTGLIPETHSSSLPDQQHHRQHSSKKQRQQYQQSHQQQQQQPPNISIRRLDTLKQDYNDSSSSIYTNKRLLLQQQQYQQRLQLQQQQQQLIQQQQQQLQQQQHQRNHKAAHRNQSSSTQNDDESNISATPAKQPRLSAREFKYKAFGSFVSSSLLDLPASAALELVEKFTSDIVKVLMENAQQQEQNQHHYQQQQHHNQQQNDSEN